MVTSEQSVTVRESVNETTSLEASGHVRKGERPPIEYVPLDSIRPAKGNDEIYGEVKPSDPAVRDLAAKIRKQGLLEPIVVSWDNVIVSGHRRRVACRLAGLENIPIRRLTVRSTDPKFHELLVSFNDQRVKSVDVQIKEAIVLADPRAAREKLKRDREKLAAAANGRIDEAGLCLLNPKAARRRSEISSQKQPMLAAAKRVLLKYEEFWPLTIRQLHYRLLNDPPLRNAKRPDSTYCNDEHSYKDLCDLITRARLTGEVAFRSIHDPTRPAESWRNWINTRGYVGEACGNFLTEYRRDLLQSQDAYFEVVAEKMTLDTIVERATSHFGMRYCIGRGYSSIDLRYHLAQRYRRSGKNRFVLLILSDMDPEGENIAETLVSSLRDEFGIKNIESIKVALRKDQVEQFGLPPGPRVKGTSSRASAYVAEHGEYVYELEAVEPEALEEIIRDAIRTVIDVNLFNREIELEEQDSVELMAIREAVQKHLAPVMRN